MQWLDRWREILQVLSRRRLRTLLTALSVAWGIFMLVILLGAGRGLESGARDVFSRDAMNSVWVSPGRITKAHRGQPIGKAITFTNQDMDLARRAAPVADLMSGRFHLRSDQVVSHGQREARFTVRGIDPDYEVIEGSQIIAGRYINPIDIAERRKVAAMGRKVADALFAPGESVIGADVRIGPFVFKVVGLFEEKGEEDEAELVYVPRTAAQLAFAGGESLTQFMFTVGTASAARTESAASDLRVALAATHGFSSADKRAIGVRNNRDTQEKFARLFAGIRSFVWLIGLGTILAAMVGVGNIMLISVQERTREIGLRKAVGATPASIVAMIVEEALAITLVSGYLGLVAGAAALEAAARFLPPSPFFRDPQVDIAVGLAATAVLVVAGMLAGFFPALRAVRVSPMAALRVE